MRAKIVNNGKVVRMSRNESTRQGFFEARYDSARERADMRCRRETWMNKRASQDRPDNPPPNPPEM